MPVSTRAGTAPAESKDKAKTGRERGIDWQVKMVIGSHNGFGENQGSRCISAEGLLASTLAENPEIWGRYTGKIKPTVGGPTPSKLQAVQPLVDELLKYGWTVTNEQVKRKLQTMHSDYNGALEWRDQIGQGLIDGCDEDPEDTFKSTMRQSVHGVCACACVTCGPMYACVRVRKQRIVKVTHMLGYIRSCKNAHTVFGSQQISQHFYFIYC